MAFKEGDISIGEQTIPALSSEEREKLEGENYRLSQEMAREEFQKLAFNKEELIAWFDDKYQDYHQDGADTPIVLRDWSGNLLEEKHFSEISPEEKCEHSSGRLKLIGDDYNLNFIKHFFNEPELLDLADKKGSYLKRTVQVYRDNLVKLN